MLDYTDAMNSHRKQIDRHSCMSMDVNHDGLPDVVCVVGAMKGTGYGFNELYLTQPGGRSLKKVQQHGLQQVRTYARTHARGERYLYPAKR